LSDHANNKLRNARRFYSDLSRESQIRGRMARIPDNRRRKTMCSTTSAAWLYCKGGRRGSVIVAAAQKTGETSLPVAITVFPDDVYRAPETWARRAYRNLIYVHEADKGEHFAAREQPELFASGLRAAFWPLR
jgi:pimeloyl-ACP methyl ester carboxylesterase